MPSLLRRATCGWRRKVFLLSAADPDIQKLPVALYHPLAGFLAHAA